MNNKSCKANNRNMENLNEERVSRKTQGSSKRFFDLRKLTGLVSEALDCCGLVPPVVTGTDALVELVAAEN